MAHYTDEFIARLQLVWGSGFLSPGGPQEVGEIVKGLDLQDRRVLDIGCGAGGPAIVLARDFGADVVCVDVEPQLLDHARQNAKAAGMSGRIDFIRVEPGPLPFEADAFDIVFSKDSLIHIPDKQALYAGVLRVLKPGGWLAASDWLAGEDAAADPDFAKYLELSHLDFAMATAAETANILREAGFADVAIRDRNAWYAGLSASEVVQIEGPLRQPIIDVAGEETYAHWLQVRRMLARSVANGSLRPTHLRGRKP